MAEYHALNQRLWQQYNSGEIDATHLQQTRFSLFAEQVNVAPMAMNETFLQQIIAPERAAGGWRRPCRP